VFPAHNARIRRTSVSLDLFSGGTFARTSEGAYLIGAPTDGSTAFLAWAAAGVRRVENRGDGAGDMLLFEGSRTNTMIRSRDPELRANKSAGTTTYPNTILCPDGTLDGCRYDTPSLNFSDNGVISKTSGLMYAHTCYGRAASGTTPWQMFISNPNRGVIGSVGTTWTRREATLAATASANGGIVAVDARDWSAASGQVAQAQDVAIDLWQMEQAYWPSSPIRTTTVSATRAADSLSYAVGQYPASFLTTGFRFTIRPDFSSTELAASGLNIILANGGAGDYFTILSTGNPRLVQGGVNRVSPAAITWSRYQALTFSVSPGGGSVVVAGATTGNGTTTGTAAAWSSAAFVIGSSSTTAFFGRYGRYFEAL
jgi:hypothetical protein